MEFPMMVKSLSRTTSICFLGNHRAPNLDLSESKAKRADRAEGVPMEEAADHVVAPLNLRPRSAN
eukprot:4992270-Pyramimonas_sp.AAC.1